MSIHLLILLLAFLCFVLSAIGVPSSRVNLQSLGLALWILTMLVH